jgi:hypothetical protein
MLERSDVAAPLWRKKVDATFLTEGSTPIPNWLVEVWGIPQYFEDVRTKKCPEAIAPVLFDGKIFDGRVVKIKRQGGYRYRLYLDARLIDLLRQTFLMSYMRTLEGELTFNKNRRDIESEIPFWEFIDIEFDPVKRRFRFVAHYTQKAWFPELFRRLVGSAPMKAIQDEISGKQSARIQKQGWKPRSDYKTEVKAENVIYTLIDTKNKLIYVGEAAKLVKRFDGGHADILEWDYYKFNQLPDDLSEHRLTIERMAIRDIAALLENKRDVGSFSISDYKLANRKIDK